MHVEDAYDHGWRLRPARCSGTKIWTLTPEIVGSVSHHGHDWQLLTERSLPENYPDRICFGFTMFRQYRLCEDYRSDWFFHPNTGWELGAD